MRARGYNERALERPWNNKEIGPQVSTAALEREAKWGGVITRCLQNQNICEAQIRTELPARGRSARYAREFSFASCHGEAESGMLRGSAVGNTSKMGRSSSPTAELCGKFPAFEIEGK